ncbi:hypothetical protein SAY87_019854 [Trapa incisa]|uniref:F-box domain-containing protein n=1 Tax=Trapa incisa TaxID=236973 RepID=A0AAN7Q3B3_9MYRT|nr:hypothetical protein SAY87_019854 [Trapa incisa]
MGTIFSHGFFQSSRPGALPTCLGDLPESCVASILTHLEPRDICGLARLNRAFRGASWADFVWVSKLPENYEALFRKVFGRPIENLNKREVYTSLCCANTFDGGTKTVWLDARTSRVCLHLSAKSLAITGIDDRRYWNHIPTQESRFGSVAYLQQTWWLEVDGELEFPFPPGTYSVFFRLQLGQALRRFGRRVCNAEHVRGWHIKPVQFQLWASNGQSSASQFFLSAPGNWMTYHAGDFSVHGHGSRATKVKFSMTQIDCTHVKVTQFFLPEDRSELRVMEPDMESMAAKIGVSVSVFRFLLCFIATIPVSFLWRLVPGRLPKHVYSAASGAILSYLSFGFSSNLHFLVPMMLGYLSMLLFRTLSGILTFFLGFGYLIGCHVYYMSGDAWKEGGIDATGALMVLTLKVISCSINYNDGLIKEEDLREAQKKNRLIKLPSLIEYFGYCLCCGSHFAGPVFEMKDYLEWTEGKGIWSRSEKGPKPSPFGATLRATIQAAFCMAMYLYLVPHYPLTRFTEPVYNEWGFWKKLSYQYMAGFTARWKYYFIWSISEASIIISGLGFSGWTESSPPEALWDRAKNVDVSGVEFAKSSVQLPLVWNIQVSTWLRHYVYERLIQKGKRPGFFQLLATQTVSAIWHGLYPGYIIFFVQSALMIAGSRVIYRWQQAVSPKMALIKNIFVFLNFAYTIMVLNYSAVGFMVLSLHETLASYGSVHYIGTVLPISLILLGHVVKPGKPARSKASKDQ